VILCEFWDLGIIRLSDIIGRADALKLVQNHCCPARGQEKRLETPSSLVEWDVRESIPPLVVHHSDFEAKSFLWYAETKTGGTHGQPVSRGPD
jgi:hypothetical protein